MPEVLEAIRILADCIDVLEKLLIDTEGLRTRRELIEEILKGDPEGSPGDLDRDY